MEQTRKSQISVYVDNKRIECADQVYFARVSTKPTLEVMFYQWLFILLNLGEFSEHLASRYCIYCFKR